MCAGTAWRQPSHVHIIAWNIENRLISSLGEPQRPHAVGDDAAGECHAHALVIRLNLDRMIGAGQFHVFGSVTTIGIISGVPQPVVVNDRLKNVPETGIYNWDPGAFFGMYRPDSFWLASGS